MRLIVWYALYNGQSCDICHPRSVSHELWGEAVVPQQPGGGGPRGPRSHPCRVRAGLGAHGCRVEAGPHPVTMRGELGVDPCCKKKVRPIVRRALYNVQNCEICQLPGGAPYSPVCVMVVKLLYSRTPDANPQAVGYLISRTRLELV